MNNYSMVIENDDSVILNIKVQPRASKNEIVGMYNDALKIRLTSPPVDGKANKNCIDFISKTFKIRKQNIDIVAGKKNRDKKIRIKGMTRKELISMIT